MAAALLSLLKIASQKNCCGFWEYKKCKALLQDALEDHKFLTREEIDKLWWNLLSDVLSDKQKKAKVGNMLTKMREERIIVNETKGNVSVWSLLKTKK